MTFGPEGDQSTGPRPETYFGLRRSEWAVVATSTSLNILVNGVLPERWHTPASLAASATVSALAARAGAAFDEQGLSPREMPRGVLFGLAAALPVGAGLAAGLLFQRSRGLYREPRIANATARRAAFEVCARIPFGTALPEEVIFRGAALGLLCRYHAPLTATAISSALFGLWHIAPTLDRLEANGTPGARGPADKATRVATAVAATSAAGFLLAWLRLRSRSIVAPWLAHCAANATGFAAAWLAARIGGAGAAVPEAPARAVLS